MLHEDTFKSIFIMSMKVEKLSLSYNGKQLYPLWVILDNKATAPVLPLLFTTHLSTHGVIYESRELTDRLSRKRLRVLDERYVSDSTIRSYVYSLSQFLDHLEQCKENYNTPGPHESSSVDSKFANHYLNHVMAKKVDSIQSLNNHRSALVAYFNWLDYMEIRPRLSLRIFRKTRQKIGEKSNKKQYIQYVSRYWRASLLNTCSTLAEKLMMRMGFEVGLRTSELVGLRFYKNSDLEQIIEKLDREEFESIEQFGYWLDGRYTKGGKSRWIYFNRVLLEDMKRYVETERKWLADQASFGDSSFFLRTDHRHIGTAIGNEQASRVFRKRANLAGLNPLLTFHDLRHTFATELFHSELQNTNGRETRSESAALITVAQRLGHSFGKDGNAPATTTRYIRMRIQMIEMEKTHFE